FLVYRTFPSPPSSTLVPYTTLFRSLSLQLRVNHVCCFLLPTHPLLFYRIPWHLFFDEFLSVLSKTHLVFGQSLCSGLYRLLLLCQALLVILRSGFLLISWFLCIHYSSYYGDCPWPDSIRILYSSQ